MKYLLSLSAALLLAAAPAAERFSSTALGISVEKPAGWHVITADQEAANRARVDTGSPELKVLVEKYANTSLYSFAKYPEPYPALNPSFRINTRSAGTLEGLSGTVMTGMVVGNLQRLIPDLRVISPPAETIVGGQPAGHATVRYGLRADGKTFPTTSEMWVVPRGSYFVVIGIGYPLPDTEKAGADLKRIVDSVRFAD